MFTLGSTKRHDKMLTQQNDALTKQQQEVLELKIDFIELKTRVTKVEKKSDDHKDDIDDLDIDIQSAERLNKMSFETCAIRLNTQSTEMQMMRTEMVALANMIKEVQSENKTLKADCSILKTDNSALTSTVDGYKSIINKLENDVKECDGKNTHTETTYAKKITVLENGEAQVKARLEKAENEVAILKSENTKIKKNVKWDHKLNTMMAQNAIIIDKNCRMVLQKMEEIQQSVDTILMFFTNQRPPIRTSLKLYNSPYDILLEIEKRNKKLEAKSLENLPNQKNILTNVGFAENSELDSEKIEDESFDTVLLTTQTSDTSEINLSAETSSDEKKNI